MSTPFNSVSNGQTIDAQHVNRYIEPIQDLESGEAWYRESSGTADAIKVNFATTANPVSAYTPGLIVHFKANATNTGAATLTITGPSGDLSAISLVKKGGVALAAGDISSGQVIAAIYTEDSGGANKRFEVLGGISSGGGGGLTSPVGIADGGTGATTASAALTALGAAPASHTHPFSQVTGTVPIAQGGTGATSASAARTALGTNDAANITAGTLPVARGGTGGANAAAARTNLGAQAQSAALDQISSQSMAKGDILVHNGTGVVKMNPGTNGQVLSANSAAGTGLQWVAQSGGGVPSTRQVSTSAPLTGGGNLSADLTLGIPQANATTDGFLDSADWATFNGKQNTLTAPGDVPGMTAALAAKADLSSGKVPVAQIPTAIPAANIGNGDVDNTELSRLNGVTSGIQGQLDGKQSTLTSPGDVPGMTAALAAKADLSSGKVPVAQIPTAIPAANIGSGDVDNTELSYLNGVTSSVQTQLNGKQSTLSAPGDVPGMTAALAAKEDKSAKGTANGYASLDATGKVPSAQLPSAGAHTHAAGDIVSGTLPIARGGTSATSASAARASLGVPGGSGSQNYLTSWSSTDALTHNPSTSSTNPLRLRGPRNLGLSMGILYWNQSSSDSGGAKGYEVFYQYSRAAHKANIATLSTSIEELMKWRAVEFDWKEEFGGGADFGLIAEEVAETYPRAAIYDQPWIYTDEETGAYLKNEDGEPQRVPGEVVPASVRYERAWIPMLAAVQDFYQRFQEEQAKVLALEARLAALEQAFE